MGKPRGRLRAFIETPELQAHGSGVFFFAWACYVKQSPAKIHEKVGNFMKRIKLDANKSSYRLLRGQKA